MAKIPLRIYNREIENLIDRGQTEEAIAHCKHILQIYPKHIDSYRLMGKSFLESQRYGEAADIFQRVLSAVPDDFVSHVGMSIIREDEGNLDAAIWHMERAFEVQPANSAVQDELRRLYGRRDGLEPPKVRLTRGALVRMYARGDLYQQAIAEIRAALAEDPQRNDLQILLARMYYLAGLKVEATEACSNILAKFPYCYEANRILAEILPGTSRADDSPIYQQRVASLDPYVSFTSANTPNVADVADAAVSLERMVWDPARVSSQPQWAESLGIQIEQTQEEQMPDWLSTVSGQVGAKQEPAGTEISEPEAADTAPSALDSLYSPVQTYDAPALEGDEPVFPAESDENLIPDWMKEAGWIPTDAKEEEPPAFDVSASEPQGQTDEISTGEMPDWLKAMAPAGLEDQGSSILPAELEETSSSDRSGEMAAEQAISADIPDWLNSVISAPEAPVVSPPEEFSSLETPAAEASEVPDWLSELKATTPESAPPEAAQPSTPTDIEIPAAPAKEAPQVSQSPQDQDDALAWLESLAAKHGAEEGTLFIPPEQRQETPPEWVQKAAESSAEPAGETSIAWQPDEPSPQQETPPAEQSLPDWMEEFASPPAQPSIETEIPAAVPGEAPDWLSSLSSTSPAAESAREPSPGPETDAEPAAEIPSTVEPSSSFPSMEDQDAAMAWLEGLATRQGADEAAMFTPPEDRTETPPQWVQESTLQAGQAVPSSEMPPEAALDQHTSAQADQENPSPAATGEELSSKNTAPLNQPAAQDINTDDALAWLEGLAAKHGAEEGTLFVPPEQRQDTPPTWVSEFAASETSSSGQDQVPQGPSEDASSTAEDFQIEPESQASEMYPQDPGIPDWLQDLKKEEAVQQTAETLGADDMPPWLQDGTPQPEAQSEPEETAAETPTPSEEESTPGEMPDWLKNLRGEEPAAAPPDSPETAPQPDLPEWLRDDTSSTAQQPEMSDTAVDWTPPEPAAPPEPLQAEGAQSQLTEIVDDTRPLHIAPSQPVTPEHQEIYTAAHQDITLGKIPEALNGYAQLIESGAMLNQTILDLREALYRYPVDVSIWEKLGDAYARDNRVQDALDAYTKAEELLR